MVRRLSLAVALALGVAPFGAHALGLGDIRLNSALNQYLNADIELLSADVDELDGIRVTLGSPAVFEKAGVARSYELTYLTFKPVVLSNGRPVIRVASREPVREPFLNFVVEMNWPKGRLIREYTLLLDPPVTVDRRPPPVTAAARAPRPVVERPRPAAAPRTDVAPSGVRGNSYGPVRRNETLWGIATRVRHDGASMSQTLVSLHQANPQAFVDQDINRLKAGAVLRLPSREEVLALAAAEADTLYRQSLAGGPPRAPAPAEPAAEAVEQPVESIERTPEAEPQVTEAAPEAELKIAAAEPGPPGAETAGESPTGKSAEELVQELALAEEAKATAELEGEELRTRVSDLEAQLADMKRLLDLKSEQLAGMQASMGGAVAPAVETADASAETPADAGAGEPGGVADEAPLATAQEPAVIVEEPQAAAEEEQAAAAGAEAKTEPAESAGAVMQTAEESAAPEKRESQGLIQRLMNDTTTLAVGLGAVVALLALLWVMISRRRASSAEFQESILVNTVDESEAEPMTPTRRGGGKVEESSFLSDFTASDIDALQDETGEVDPIAEADVYIAYGRFRQAEELIRQAVDREPGRNDLIVKLFEILSATKDGAAFAELAEKQAADGFEERDAEGWARVLEMGVALAPDHRLFAGATAAGGSGDDAGLDLDIDLRGREGRTVADQGPAEYDIDVGPLEAGDEGLPKGPPDLESEELELPASKPKEGMASGFDFQFDRDVLDRGTAEAAPKEVDEIPGVVGEEGPGDDEVNTKLDLARAYVEMGDEEDAREILKEVLAEGDEQQRREAQEILDGIA